MKINMINREEERIKLVDIENAKLATHISSTIEAESAARKAWLEDTDNYLPRLIKGDAVDILNYVDDEDIPENKKKDLDKLRKMACNAMDLVENKICIDIMNTLDEISISSIKIIPYYDALVHDNIVSVFITNKNELYRIDFKTIEDRVYICHADGKITQSDISSEDFIAVIFWTLYNGESAAIEKFPINITPTNIAA